MTITKLTPTQWRGLMTLAGAVLATLSAFFPEYGELFRELAIGLTFWANGRRPGDLSAAHVDDLPNA